MSTKSVSCQRCVEAGCGGIFNDQHACAFPDGYFNILNVECLTMAALAEHIKDVASRNTGQASVNVMGDITIMTLILPKEIERPTRDKRYEEDIVAVVLHQDDETDEFHGAWEILKNGGTPTPLNLKVAEKILSNDPLAYSFSAR